MDYLPGKFQWIVIVTLCLAGAVFSWMYFSSAFPILDVEISMDRRQALRRAEEVTGKHELGPPEPSQAASFSQDREVQTFVELEAGGKKAFRQMIRKGLYQPFQWHVRHYQPGESRETRVRFTPDGRLYGFSEKWPEEDTGPALSEAEARSIAETGAVNAWNVELSKYELLSSGSNELPNGRLDHTFVYERKEAEIGEGSYRLRLEVSGDQLSQVTRFVKVPEAFNRRYENMRSSNRLIQSAGTVFVYVGYLLVGCFLGAYWLLSRDALKWRTALAWGGFITVLLFLAGINSLPLAWMSYDTALAPGSFLAQQVINSLSSALIFGVIISLTFVAAEGLTREAFGHQPRFWRLWSPRAASSRTVLSLTTLGYCLTGLYFAYNVGLYSYALESLGWWIPSNLMYDPNVLAHYVVWLKPVTNALRAGFWEECLFRAVPLAGAALLGERFGRRRWWIGFALVFQALVFGAGHAAYATQPAYARLVELFFSSLAMGGLYLAYGLLPVIIIHFIYDLVLMSIPILVSSAAGIWFSQAAVAAVALVPLAVVLLALLYTGELIGLAERFYNRAHGPEESGQEQRTSFPVPRGLSWRQVGLLVIAGLVGLSVWIGYEFFRTYETPLLMNRTSAEKRAKKLLEQNGQDPGEWTAVASVTNTSGSSDDAFVWQTGDSDAYQQLMGSYLHGPSWQVRFITFEGSVAERAEEYRVVLAPGEYRQQVRHKLPEAAGGDSLPRPAARRLADSAVQNRYGSKTGKLSLVRARPKSRPNRRDWTFVYEDPENYPLDRGGARLSVHLAGSEVTGTTRYVHLPENWERENRSRKTIINLIKRSARTLLQLLVLAGALAGLVYWGKGESFSIRAVLLTFGLYLLIVVLSTANSWPEIMAGLNTSEPFWSQVAVRLLGRVTTLVGAAVFALIAGLTHAQLGRNQTASPERSSLAGLSLAAIAAGLLTYGASFVPELAPQWGGYGGAGQLVPWLSASLGSAKTLLQGSLILLLFAAVQHKLSRAGTRYKLFANLFAAVAGAILGVVTGGSYLHPATAAVFGGGFAVLFVVARSWLMPNDRAFVPVSVAGFLAIGQLKAFLISSHPEVLVGQALSTVVLLGLGIYWTRLLTQVESSPETE